MRPVPISVLFLIWLLPAVLTAAGQPSRSQQLIAEGDEALARGDRREADVKYTQAVLADRAYLPARIALGKFEFDGGDWADAEDQFRAAIRIDPDDLEARYFQGMVKREQGRHRPPLTGWLLDEFKDARTHLEFVIERDSTFRDVLYQYALLQQYRGDERAAMDLAHRQARIKPDDPASIAGLFKMGRMYSSLRGTGNQDWLAPLSAGYKTLFRAESERREGALDTAQSLLLELLQDVDSVPRTSVHLLLARVFAAGHHDEAAEVQFWTAVDAIEGPGDAALVLEEVKYVLNDDELSRYDALDAPDAFREFFRTAWSRRDPMPAAATNARLAEHFRRLNEAEDSYEHFRPRTFFNDPDINSALAFGRVYTLNQNFNDKGLIFIRHGPPDERIFTGDDEGALSRALQGREGAGGFRSTMPGLMEPLPVESWRYYRSGDQPELIFHFATRAGGNWRLIAAPMWLQALHDRREWGTIYAEAFQAVANRETIEIPRLSMRMQHEAQEYVEAGLDTDRHSWAEHVVPLQLPATIAAFRGDDRSTLVHVFYAFPTRPIAGYVPSTDPVEVEVGLAVHDSAWATTVSRRDKKRVLPSATKADFAAGALQFSIEPGTYTVSMHVKPADTPLIGGWKRQLAFPDFSAGSLSMSDLILSTSISPAGDDSPFVRGDVNVLPSFTRRYTTEQPVFVYYEIYNLALNSADHTSYSTEIELRPQEPRGRGPFGIFGRNDRPVLSLRTEGTGTVISPTAYSEVDMSDVEPGAYRLVVRVLDNVAGIQYERSQDLELVAP